MLAFLGSCCVGNVTRLKEQFFTTRRNLSLQSGVVSTRRLPGSGSGPRGLCANSYWTASTLEHGAPPLTYPVTTSSRRGVCFVVAAGYVATCEHTVRGESSVAVGGSPGEVLATCASDIALVYVPALSGVNPPFLAERQSCAFAAPGMHVQILSAAGETVRATVVDMPGILYSSSGAVLPALRLKVCGPGSGRDHSSAERIVCKGWSGAPVVNVETHDVLGMVVHGDKTADFGGTADEFVFAAPAGVLHCFIKSSLLRTNLVCDRKPGTQLRAWCYNIAALAPLTFQPLSSPQSFAALREMSHRPGWKACCDRLLAGVRVINTPTGSVLQTNDVLVKAGDFPVDKDGCITRWGMRTTLHAAFIGADYGSCAKIQVLRASEAGRAEIETVTVTLGGAVDVLVRVPAQSNGDVLLAGAGGVDGMRLVEVSVDWLQERYGEGWVSCCDHDIYATVFREGSDSRSELAKKSTVVIARNDSHPELVGSRVVAAEGQDVYNLCDILGVTKALDDARAVVIQTADGWVTTLPQPINLKRVGT